MKEMRWCAIGDSFTYLNDHLDETGYRVSKGYLTRILEKVPGLRLDNIGINGSTLLDWASQPIPEADLPHVFEKFYKVDKARTREYGGSGIGLSIVRAIMEGHNQKCGAVNLEQGVAFWFELELCGEESA